MAYIYTKTKRHPNYDLWERNTYVRQVERYHKFLRPLYIKKMGGKCSKCKGTTDLWFYYKGKAKGLKTPYRFSTVIKTAPHKAALVWKDFTLICKKCQHKHNIHNPRKKPKHGSVSRYTNQRCRCPKCGEAWRVYIRTYDKKKKEAKQAELKLKQETLKLLTDAKFRRIFNPALGKPKLPRQDSNLEPTP